MEETPLSDILRRKELARLDNTIEEVNGFNSIRADMLTQWDKQRAFMRIYFSVEHGYTPVRYEYMSGEKVSVTVEVQSLEQVAEGLWFPSSGVISSLDKSRSHAYIATSKIVVNQGLPDKYFDIKFPPGTKVRDNIEHRKYVVPAK